MSDTLPAHEIEARLQEGNAVLLDVRQGIEYRSGHIPGARHIPLLTLPFRARELPADRPIIVYCASGHRSPLAVAILRSQGFKNIVELQGGLARWSGPKEK